jgi:hypothetical protein
LTNAGAKLDGSSFEEGSSSMTFSSSSLQYAIFPSSLNLSQVWGTRDSITFSLWAKMSPDTLYWSRLFEFGDSLPEYGIASQDSHWYSDPYGPSNFVDMFRWDSFITMSIGKADERGSYVQSMYQMTDQSCIDNRWHHIVWSISSQGLWSVYWDGTLVNPGDSTVRLTIPRSAKWSKQFLGRHVINIWETGNGYLTGSIDDFRIYNRVLNASEVEILYKTPGAQL